jgi:hypothetical protein
VSFAFAIVDSDVDHPGNLISRKNKTNFYFFLRPIFVLDRTKTSRGNPIKEILSSQLVFSLLIVGYFKFYSTTALLWPI